MFRKNKQNDGRTRQPIARGGPGTTPVFSYHAQSARTEPTGIRRASKLLWTSPTKPSPRRDPRHWPKRVLVTSGIILAAALGINSLFLAREPSIVVTAQADGRQLLLRDQDVYHEAARAILAGSLANTNKLTINTGKIAETMKQQFPELESVAVVLPIIGRQPTLHIQSIRPTLLLNSAGSGIFLVDDSGRAVMEASKVGATVKAGLPVIEDQSRLPIKLGASALPRDNIDFITEVMGQLKAKSLKVTAMVLPAGASELDVRVEGAPYIIKFNLRGDARAGVGAYLAVKQHLEREKKVPGSYIDVRVDNKAYYR